MGVPWFCYNYWLNLLLYEAVFSAYDYLKKIYYNRAKRPFTKKEREFLNYLLLHYVQKKPNENFTGYYTN